MRTRLFLAAIALMSFLLPASAAFAAGLPTDCDPHDPKNKGYSCLTLCSGGPCTCTQPGETTMDGDIGNLIACLQKDPQNGDASLVWKAMTMSGDTSPPGTLCGYYRDSSDGAAFLDIPCKGQSLFSYGTTPVRLSSSPSCPAGYSSITLASFYTPGSPIGLGETSSPDTFNYEYVCRKKD